MPFTREQFFEVFRSYNDSVWPAQIVLVVIAIVVVVLSMRQRNARWIGWLLAGLWTWCAVAYFWGELTAITAAAWLFGALFATGAFLLIHEYDTPVAGAPTPARRTIGALLVLYALALYPLIGHTFSHRYPSAPTFGAPCPLTIFTIGILLTTRHPLRFRVIAAPVLWSLIGGSAALTLGVPQDIALPVAGLIALGFAAVDLHSYGGSHERHRTLHA